MVENASRDPAGARVETDDVDTKEPQSRYPPGSNVNELKRKNRVTDRGEAETTRGKSAEQKSTTSPTDGEVLPTEEENVLREGRLRSETRYRKEVRRATKRQVQTGREESDDDNEPPTPTRSDEEDTGQMTRPKLMTCRNCDYLVDSPGVQYCCTRCKGRRGKHDTKCKRRATKEGILQMVIANATRPTRQSDAERSGGSGIHREEKQAHEAKETMDVNTKIKKEHSSNVRVKREQLSPQRSGPLSRRKSDEGTNVHKNASHEWKSADDERQPHDPRDRDYRIQPPDRISTRERSPISRTWKGFQHREEEGRQYRLARDQPTIKLEPQEVRPGETDSGSNVERPAVPRRRYVLEPQVRT